MSHDHEHQHTHEIPHRPVTRTTPARRRWPRRCTAVRDCQSRDGAYVAAFFSSGFLLSDRRKAVILRFRRSSARRKGFVNSGWIGRILIRLMSWSKFQFENQFTINSTVVVCTREQELAAGNPRPAFAESAVDATRSRRPQHHSHPRDAYYHIEDPKRFVFNSCPRPTPFKTR